MNKQKVFDEIKAHLLAQNEQSLVTPEPNYEDRVCQYRGRKSLKCAIGALIPDSLYRDSMDAGMLGMDDLILNYPEIEDHFADVYGVETKQDREFLSRFQRLHDKKDPEEWPQALAYEADLHGLKA